MDRAIDQYLAYLRVERNLSAHTLSAYQQDLRLLQAYLAPQQLTSLTAIEKQHLEQFMHTLSVKSKATQARITSTLKHFFRFLKREQMLLEDPARELSIPKLKRRLPWVLAAAEAERLVEAPKLCELNLNAGQQLSRPKKRRLMRDHAILELLYGSGLRASELCTLCWAALDFARGIVRLRGKGAKERVVPLGDWASLALRAYRAEVLPEGERLVVRPARAKPAKAAKEPTNSRARVAGQDTAWVFPGRRGKPLTRMALFKIVKRYERFLTTPQALSPHKLRHAFATHLLQGGADLRAVQEMLGHASVMTTEIYTHVTTHELQQVLEDYHPLGSGGESERPRKSSPSSKQEQTISGGGVKMGAAKKEKQS